MMKAAEGPNGHLQLGKTTEVSEEFHKATHTLIRPPAQMANLIAVSCNRPRCWRLVVPTDETDETEEAVFRVQGVVCGKQLPPVMEAM